LSGSSTFFFRTFAPAFILSPIVSVSFSVSPFLFHSSSSSPAWDAIYSALDSPPGRGSPLSFISTFLDSIVGFFVSVVGDIFLAVSATWLPFSDLEIMYSALDSPPDRESPFSFLSTFDSSSCISNAAIAFNVYKQGRREIREENLQTRAHALKEDHYHFCRSGLQKAIIRELC
jgi:hypothetical protein